MELTAYALKDSISIFIHGSEMIEIHSTLGDIPSSANRCDVEDKDECDRIQKYVRLVENRQRCIAQECYIDVVEESGAPNCITKETRQKVRIVNQTIKEQWHNDVN